MTTVDKILLKLDYVAKEQEDELAFFALDDVIGRFENAIAVIYSEAGIPLKSYDYLVKAESDELKGYEELLGKESSELDEEEKQRVYFARGVRNVYNKLKKSHEAANASLSLIDDLYSDMMDNLLEGEPRGVPFKRSKQGKLPKGAKELLGIFAAQADAVAEAVADGKSDEEIRGIAFPKRGFRLNVESDAGVDIQAKITLSPDGKSFRLAHRPMGKGKWTAITGGKNKGRIGSFGAALRQAENVILKKAGERGAQFAGVDIGEGRAKRKWLKENVKHDFQKTMVRGDTKLGQGRGPSEDDSDKDANAQNILENWGSQAKKSGVVDLVNQAEKIQANYINEDGEFDVDSYREDLNKHSGSDFGDLYEESEYIPRFISTKPQNMLFAVINGLFNGQIKNKDDLFSTLKNASRRIAYNPEHPDYDGSARADSVIRAKNSIGGFFSNIAKHFSAGFKKGFEEGQYAGSGSAQYRAPDSEQYRQNPRAYWQERGKLVTMMAQADANYEDAIKKAMVEPVPEARGDMIEIAMARFARSEDTIESIAKEKTGTSLGAIREHLNQIQQGNKHAMPPGAGFPPRFGGAVKINQLKGNVTKYVPETARREPGALGQLAEQLQGPRGQSLDAEGQGPGINQPEQGDERLVRFQDPAGGKSVTIPTSDREYLKPEQTVAPNKARIYTAERRGPEGRQARYYSKKEAAAKADEQKNGQTTEDDSTTPSDDTTQRSDDTTPTPTPRPTPEPKRQRTAPPTKEESAVLEGERAAFQPQARKQVIADLLNEPESANIPPEEELHQLDDKELRRLSLQVKAQKEQAEKDAQEPQGSEVNAAGENEMTTPIQKVQGRPNPGAIGSNVQKVQTPQEQQDATFTAAIDNEVAASKKDAQKQKVRVARANATQSRARADVAEVRARAAEEDRDSNIAEILSKLDSNIDGLVIKGNPEVSKVFVQLEATIDSIEKQNPFAMLGANISREMKIMGQGSKKKKEPAVPSQTKSEIPEEADKVQPMPETPAGNYDPHGATEAPSPSSTREKFSGSRYQKSEFDKLFGRKKPEAPTTFGGSRFSDKPQKAKAPSMTPKMTAHTGAMSAVADAQGDADAAKDAMRAAGLVKALDGHINNL